MKKKMPFEQISPKRTLEQLNMCSDFPKKSIHSSFYGAFIILQNVGELQYIVISHEETGSKIRSGRFHTTAPLPWLLMCFTFGKCPQSCLGNVQSGHTIMTMQQSSHAKSLGPQSPRDRKEVGQWNNMALTKSGNDQSMFLSLGTHWAGFVTGCYGPMLPSF